MKKFLLVATFLLSLYIPGLQGMDGLYYMFMDYANKPDANGRTPLFGTMEIPEKLKNDEKAIASFDHEQSIIAALLISDFEASVYAKDKSSSTPLKEVIKKKDLLPKVYEVIRAAQLLEDNKQAASKYNNALEIIKRYRHADLTEK